MPDMTLPARPYGLSLAIRTASSSSSNGITTRTGPKISSWAIVIELSTSTKSVGLTKKPLSSPSGCSAPPTSSVAPSSIPFWMYPRIRLRCLSEMTGPQSVPGSCGSPARDALVDSLEDLDALVVPRPRQQHPGGVGAALAGVHARRDAHHAAQREVGVLEHDGRRLAAEFEEEALHRRRALLHDPLADDRRTGERDQVDLRRQREFLADEMV